MTQSQLLRQSEEISYQQEVEQDGDEVVLGKDVDFASLANFDLNNGSGTSASGLFTASGCVLEDLKLICPCTTLSAYVC